MKRIKDFNDFINEAEASENDDKTKDNKDFEHLPRLKPVVDKEFFNELKQHIFYWLNYDFLKKKYTMSSLEADKTEVTVWFSDNGEIPLYQYKITYSSNGDDAEIVNVENVNMMIWIYEFENQELLKQSEMKIGLKYLNAKSFNNFIDKVKDRIIRTPKDGEDVDNFKRKETRRLGDNIY